MASRNERTKTIKFNMDKPDERELWERLARLLHGEFSERTKAMWKAYLKDITSPHGERQEG